MKRFLLLPIFTSIILFSAYSQNKDIPDELTEKLTQQTELIKTLQETINQQAEKIEAIEKQSVTLQRSISRVTRETNSLQENNKEFKKELDSIKRTTASDAENLQSLEKNFQDKIEETSTAIRENKGSLSSYKKNNNTGWIIASLTVLLLGTLIYLFLKKRIDRSKVNVEEQIKETRNTLEEESVKLDSKLVDILESQIKLSEEQKRSNKEVDKQEEDHSLALKVADEIVRIQRNLSQMDSKTRGLKQLSRSIQRIQNNFTVKGYEIVELLGKDYDSGMRVSPTFNPDETLEAGKQIITKIIKPQVNYKGEMIQSAQIEVNIGNKK